MFESAIKESLFLPLNLPLHHSNYTLRGCFGLTFQEEQFYHIACTSEFITIFHPSSAFYTLIDFDLKFQVIYQTSEVEQHITKQHPLYQAKPLGFKLFRMNLMPFCIYMRNEENLQKWIQKLSSCLNQFGFHNIFKGVKKLGKGATATVYQVVRNTDNKRFAVKAFTKSQKLHSNNSKQKQSFLNQLSIIRQLKHPNLMQLQGIFQSQNSLYLVLQLLSAGHMHARAINKKCNFQLRQIQQFMFSLLAGLRYMAEKNIVHRDIKLQNIMLRSALTMEAVIADFGLAEDVTGNSHLYFRCGTPGFVAPQVINMQGDQLVTPKCDVFSAGTIFHILLMKKPLFDGKDFKEVYANNKQLKFDLNGSHYQQVNPEAMDLLRKLLIIDPKKRICAGEALKHSFFADYIGSCALQQIETINTFDPHLIRANNQHRFH